jgi:quinol monooxygenase YgiN
MSKVAVAVKLRIKAGQRDAATEVIKPFLAVSEGEVGTLTYILHHDALDADVVWLY